MVHNQIRHPFSISHVEGQVRQWEELFINTKTVVNNLRKIQKRHMRVAVGCSRQPQEGLQTQPEKEDPSYA